MVTEKSEQKKLIEEARWTELLSGLRSGNTHSFVFPNVKAMESCRVVGVRMNMMGESENTFRFRPNFADKILVIMVDKRA